MKSWLRRVRGMIGMGVTWALGWAAFGILIGIASNLLPWLPWDRFFDIFDAPLPALAVPGFIGGVLFSVVLGIAGRNRKFDELSLGRFAAWGALGGLLLGVLPDAMVAAGLATLGRPDLSLWKLTAVITPPLMLLCAASACGSLALARIAERRGLLSSGRQVDGVGFTRYEAQAYLREMRGSLNETPSRRIEER